MRRLSAALFLLTLALLPWGGLLRAGLLHEHAQWSDVVFAAAAAAWLAEVCLSRPVPRLRAVHAALAAYLVWALLSLAFSSPRAASGPAKWLGMAMLVTLFILTSDVVRSREMPRAMAWTVAAGSLLTALAAVIGVALSARGTITPLVGACGDILPGPFSRAQAGFIHPNLMASYSIFAAGVVSRPDAGLPRWLRRTVLVALAATVALATSRALLGFALALLVARATTPARRRWAWAAGAVGVAAMVVLSATHLLVDPVRPWEMHLAWTRSPRTVAIVTSARTFLDRPLFGSGPGNSPGWHARGPFDAHLTPLNVAATLGAPALLALGTVVVLLWRKRARPTDLVTWGMLFGLGLDALGQDVEDFRHVWIALGVADAGRREREE